MSEDSDANTTNSDLTLASQVARLMGPLEDVLEAVQATARMQRRISTTHYVSVALYALIIGLTTYGLVRVHEIARELRSFEERTSTTLSARNAMMDRLDGIYTRLDEHHSLSGHPKLQGQVDEQGKRVRRMERKVFGRGQLAPD